MCEGSLSGTITNQNGTSIFLHPIRGIDRTQTREPGTWALLGMAPRHLTVSRNLGGPSLSLFCLCFDLSDRPVLTAGAAVWAKNLALQFCSGRRLHLVIFMLLHAGFRCSAVDQEAGHLSYYWLPGKPKNNSWIFVTVPYLWSSRRASFLRARVGGCRRRPRLQCK